MTPLQQAQQHIFDKAIARGVTPERAKWLVSEFDDIQRVHGLARAYQVFISRMIG